MTVAEGQHVDHPICGATCTDKYKHSIVTEWKSIDSEAALQAATEGYYYLTQDIVTMETWKPNNNVVLCLNGHSIAANGDFVVIEIDMDNLLSVTAIVVRVCTISPQARKVCSLMGAVRGKYGEPHLRYRWSYHHSVGRSDLGVKVDNNATFYHVRWNYLWVISPRQL